MPIFRIPVTSSNQEFNVILDGIRYALNLYWNKPMMLWVLDFKNTDTGEMLANGVPMVTGCDVLEQFKYLGFTGSLVAYLDSSLEPPKHADLDGGGRFYFITDLSGLIAEVSSNATV